MKKLVFEGKFPYKGYFNCDCICGLTIHQIDDKVVVLCTELSENTGTSVTNMAEGIATEVMMKFNLDPTKMVWVEHYDYRDRPKSHRSLNHEETFDLCVFSYNAMQKKFYAPKWFHSTKENYEKLIGEE